MNPIVFAIVVVVVLGLAGGVILVLASKFMAVYDYADMWDQRMQKILLMMWQRLTDSLSPSAMKRMWSGCNLMNHHW